jgi:hypothetical protein
LWGESVPNCYWLCVMCCLVQACVPGWYGKRAWQHTRCLFNMVGWVAATCCRSAARSCFSLTSHHKLCANWLLIAPRICCSCCGGGAAAALQLPARCRGPPRRSSTSGSI